MSCTLILRCLKSSYANLPSCTYYFHRCIRQESQPRTSQWQDYSAEAAKGAVVSSPGASTPPFPVELHADTAQRHGHVEPNHQGAAHRRGNHRAPSRHRWWRHRRLTNRQFARSLGKLVIDMLSLGWRQQEAGTGAGTGPGCGCAGEEAEDVGAEEEAAGA